MKQNIYYEENILSFTNDLLNLNPKSILIVSDSSSYETCGAKELIDRLFGKYNLLFFNDFTVNPKIHDLKKGINFCKNVEIDLIVAIGGGSVIDMAKLIRCYKNLNIDIIKAIKSNIIFSKQNIPLVAIPTTAGSGSESTHFSVIYINNSKYSICHETILPNYVLLIPSLTFGTPHYLTACSGADAFCQAIESYWSIHSTEESRNYAKDAIILLWKYLPQALVDDIEARKKVLFAANLSGRAINISFTTAAHAYSYGLTTYLGIPHGHAVSLTLPYFFNLNMNISSEICNDPRGSEFVNHRMNELLLFLDCKSENVGKKLYSFFYELFGNKNNDIKSNITGIIRKQLSLAVDSNRLKNNPVKVSQQLLYNMPKQREFYCLDQEILTKLRSVFIEILDEFVSICRDNNLSYFLHSGTLLGAIRHKGIIPWDDDLDVGMPRKHYNKFLDIINSSKDSNYYIYSPRYSIKEKFHYNKHSKFCKKGTLIALSKIKNPNNYPGISICIFPFDNCIRFFNPIHHIFIRFGLKLYMCKTHQYNPVAWYKRYIIKTILLIPMIFIYSLYKKSFLFFNSFNTKYISFFSGIYGYKKETHSINTIFPLTEYLFEGKYYNVPGKYNIFLKTMYSNFMDIPPIENRKTHPYKYIIFDDSSIH